MLLHVHVLSQVVVPFIIKYFHLDFQGENALLFKWMSKYLDRRLIILSSLQSSHLVLHDISMHISLAMPLSLTS